MSLLCAKWFVSLEGERPPDLDEIRKHRGDSVATTRAHSRWKSLKDWIREGLRAERNGQPALEQIDLDFVDRIVAEEGRGVEAAIPILQRIQQHYRYLPDEALRRVCELTEISPAQIAGVSSFYAQFRRSPVGRHIIKVCHGTACHVAGAREITEEIRRRLNIPPDADTDPDRFFTVDEVACLGCCSLAPVIMIDETTAGKLTPATACEAIGAFRAEHS
ncbi:MAG TPA: NAD(P)H-dependent oxidoreductase subunit E [Planctomycetaceae bacterium]|nr:NAD(P)H-dependent oxidoreductase subunit E [Planctomycetaceae bacterium]